MIVGEQYLQLAPAKAIHPLLYQYVPILEAAARRAEYVSSRTGNAFRLGVTSLDRGAGVSTLASNLALAAVKIVRRSTTLVEAGTASPSMEASFAADFAFQGDSEGKRGSTGERALGFADAILGRCDVEKVVRPSKSAGLSLVPAGNGKLPRELDDSADLALEAALSEIQDDSNWLIIDLPPMSEHSTTAIAACLDGIIVLVYGKRTTSVQLNEAVAKYTKLGIPVLGTVYRHVAP